MLSPKIENSDLKVKKHPTLAERAALSERQALAEGEALAEREALAEGEALAEHEALAERSSDRGGRAVRLNLRRRHSCMWQVSLSQGEGQTWG